MNGRGQGSNTKIAKASCALSIVRQLFHMGVIPSSSEPISKKLRVTDLPELRCNVDKALQLRMTKYLTEVFIYSKFAFLIIRRNKKVQYYI